MKHYTVFIIAGILSPLAALAAEPGNEQSRTQDDVPDVFPTSTRDNRLRNQDDHLHTTPDAAIERFKALDEDNDRRLQWDEVQVVGMRRHIFNTLDTDGSGSLDRGEYVAVSPSPESDYRQRGLPEP